MFPLEFIKNLLFLFDFTEESLILFRVLVLYLFKFESHVIKGISFIIQDQFGLIKSGLKVSILSLLGFLSSSSLFLVLSELFLGTDFLELELLVVDAVLESFDLLLVDFDVFL